MREGRIGVSERSGQRAHGNTQPVPQVVADSTEINRAPGTNQMRSFELHTLHITYLVKPPARSGHGLSG